MKLCLKQITRNGHIVSRFPFSDIALQRLIYSAMVNHAKSDALKMQIARQKQGNLMAQAVAHFYAKLLDSDTERSRSDATVVLR